MSKPSRVTRTTSSSEQVTLESINAKLDKVLAHYDQLNGRLEKLERENKEATKSLTFLHDEVSDIKKQLAATPPPKLSPSPESGPTSAEHLARQRSVEFSGIDFTDGEDLIKMIEQLCQQLDLNITRNDIDTVYRNKNKSKVVVRLLQQHKRDTLYATHRGADIKTSDLGLSTDHKVYANELLSYDQRRLYYLTRKLKKENSYKFAWTANQKIFIRKSEDSEVIHVKSESCLQRISSTSDQ